ncbi:uncharacterized protein LOC133627320 [Colius striatus]|uniref:uncharacterized protein LOC133627320 n=1 Tax=Colius striatus TaxID=57412 RepID=UPI002B1E5A3B|nr:uncharacterized protein LOC133627320 [Colius striatus]
MQPLPLFSREGCNYHSWGSTPQCQYTAEAVQQQHTAEAVQQQQQHDGEDTDGHGHHVPPYFGHPVSPGSPWALEYSAAKAAIRHGWRRRRPICLAGSEGCQSAVSHGCKCRCSSAGSHAAAHLESLGEIELYIFCEESRFPPQSPHEAEKPSVQEGGSSTVTVSANRAGAAHPGAVPEADEVPLEKVADPQTGSRTVAVSEEKTRPFQSTAVPGVEGEKNSKAERLLGFQTHFLIFAGTFFCLCLLLSLLVALICLYKKRKRIPSPSSVAQDSTSSSHTSKESDPGSNTIQQNVIWTQGQQPPAVPGSSSVPQLTSQTAGICGTGLSPSSEKASCLSPLVTIPKEARKWSQKKIITITIDMTDRNLGSAEDLAALPEADTSSNLKLNDPAGSAKGTGATQAGEVGKGLIRAQP